MGFKTIAACFLLVTLISCSRPAQENSSAADSTSTSPDSLSTAGSQLEPAVLTPEETARVNLEVFMRLRQGYVNDDGASYAVAYREDFHVNGNKFDYTLMRHNADHAGLTASEEPYSETSQRYIPEIDTFYVTGEYTVVQEKGLGKQAPLTCNLTGTEKHVNAVVDPDGDDRKTKMRISMIGYNGNGDVFGITLGSPMIFTPDWLFVKAKVADLTDKDLEGLGKDDLAFVRNDIFARHGHTFKTPKMIDHYKDLEWYHAVIDDATSLLNKFERRNVEFIKKKEG
ncbi:MAG: YARHG domain-containing protein [Bacteroidota bacterium]